MPKKRTLILSMPPAVGSSVLKTTTVQKRFFFDEASPSSQSKKDNMRSVMVRHVYYRRMIATNLCVFLRRFSYVIITTIWLLFPLFVDHRAFIHCSADYLRHC